MQSPAKHATPRQLRTENRSSNGVHPARTEHVRHSSFDSVFATHKAYPDAGKLHLLTGHSVAWSCNAFPAKFPQYRFQSNGGISRCAGTTDAALLPDPVAIQSKPAARTRSDVHEAHKLRRLCQTRTEAEEQPGRHMVRQRQPHRQFTTCSLKRPRQQRPGTQLLHMRSTLHLSACAIE